MALLPRKKWTNQLAWAVWAQRRNNKRRQALPLYPMGRFPSVSSIYYREPIRGSTALKRYQWNMDGQDDFSLRGDAWICTNPVIEGEFIGKTAASTYFIFDGDASGVDRAYLFINANTGFLNSNATTMELNGVVVTDNTVMGDVGEINHFKLTFTGTYRVQVRGARYSLDQLFSPTAIPALYLIDPLDDDNTDMTRFSSNGAIETAIGHEMGEELIRNGKPTSTLSWGANNSTLSVDSEGYMEVLGVVASSTNMNQSFFTELGVSYRVEFENKKGTAPNTQTCRIGTAPSSGSVVNQAIAEGFTVIEFTGIGVDTYISLGFGETLTGQTSLWRGISVKEIPASAWTHNNGEPDKSDFELIERESDNSGWVGDGTNYPYAAGAIA